MIERYKMKNHKFHIEFKDGYRKTIRAFNFTDAVIKLIIRRYIISKIKRGHLTQKEIMTEDSKCFIVK